MKKRFRFEVTYWGECDRGNFTGSLPDFEKFLNDRQLIPRVGDSVLLPNVLKGATALREPDSEGYSTQNVIAEWDEVHVGKISSVMFTPSHSERITIGVKPEPMQTGKVRD